MSTPKRSRRTKRTANRRQTALGVLAGLLLVTVFVGRSLPREWLAGNALGVIAPVVVLALVGLLILAVSLSRS